MHDYIIIGCGISGLYIGNKLSSSGYNVLLFDKRERIGGRIISIKDKNENVYDVGAVKIPSDQLRINRLIKKLGLEDNKLLINDKIKYDRNGKYTYKKNISKLINKAVKSNIDINTRCGQHIAENLFDNKFSMDLINMSGYNGNFEKLNFKAFIKYNGDINRKYYILKDGLSQICNKLIEEGNLHIKLESTLLSYKYDNKTKIFTIKIERNKVVKTYKSHGLILAIPQKELQILFNSNKFNQNKHIKHDNITYTESEYIEPLLSSVVSNNYMRIFATYPKEDGKVWFENIKDTHTSRIIRKASPYNKETGIMQISYSDGRYANMWQNSLLSNQVSGNNNIYNEIHKELVDLYPKCKIPQPTQYTSHYWSNGTHYWLPNVNINKIHNTLLKPFNYSMYICGETYSNYQAWMEGALETADKVYKMIISRKSKPHKSNSIKYYTIDEVKKHNKETDAWIIYKNKVYDVTKFIYKHPGSLAILKGVGKDATSIFDKIGHSNRARNIMRKYYIGNIKL